MVTDLRLVGVMFLAFGIPGAVFPYRVTKVGEQIDAFGSKTPRDEIEPAEWNVTLTRFVGVFATVLGVAYLFA
jgi:hypothetical protein